MLRTHATFILLVTFNSAINCSPPNQLRANFGLQQPGAYPYPGPGPIPILEPVFPVPLMPAMPREVSVIAHMANTPDSIRWALGQGANGIEFDLNFAGTLPSKFYHGSPCDCSLNFNVSPFLPPTDNICSSLQSSCEVSTSFDNMTNFLGSSEIVNSKLAIIYIDSKIDTSIKDYYEAGKNVVKGFNEKVMKKGFRGQIIISCSQIIQSDYLRGAYNEAYKSSYVNQYFYTIDGEGNGNEKKVLDDLKTLGTANIVYSVGITALLPLTYKDAITFSVQSNSYAGIGIWTLEKESSIADYLSYGVTMIVTNTPQKAVNQCRLSNINLPSPGTGLTPKVLPPLPNAPYWECDCSSYSSISLGYCRVTKRAPYNYACYCDPTCKFPKNVICNSFLQLCRTPNVTLEACKLGGGNCDGY